jgi:RAQPRD family integrative conjugative element protein
MTQRGPATADRLLTLAIALAVGLSVDLPARAADAAVENAQLAAIERQLDLLDREAQQNASRPPEPGNRYHFDYARLRADIARIRAGIHNYLSPPRAQPRDPDSLSGQYRSETSSP